MNSAGALVATGAEVDPNSVSPGLIGFVATFVLVVAAVFLFRSMTGHLRRVDHRSRLADQDVRDSSSRDVPDHASDERAEESSLEDPGPPDASGGPPPAR